MSNFRITAVVVVRNSLNCVIDERVVGRNQTINGIVRELLDEIEFDCGDTISIEETVEED